VRQIVIFDLLCSVVPAGEGSRDAGSAAAFPF